MDRGAVRPLRLIITFSRRLRDRQHTGDHLHTSALHQKQHFYYVSFLLQDIQAAVLRLLGVLIGNHLLHSRFTITGSFSSRSTDVRSHLVPVGVFSQRGPRCSRLSTACVLNFSSKLLLFVNFTEKNSLHKPINVTL